MTHSIRLLTLATCLTLLSACANDEPDKATLFQDQVESLDKARAVEETLLKSNQQQREAIDSQSQ